MDAGAYHAATLSNRAERDRHERTESVRVAAARVEVVERLVEPVPALAEVRRLGAGSGADRVDRREIGLCQQLVVVGLDAPERAKARDHAARFGIGRLVRMRLVVDRLVRFGNGEQLLDVVGERQQAAGALVDQGLVRADLADQEVIDGVYSSIDAAKIRELVHQKSEPSLILANYAGWGPGQLEGEIDEGSWLSTPAGVEHVFRQEEDDLWEAVVRSLTGSNLADLLGLRVIPPDPNLN